MNLRQMSFDNLNELARKNVNNKTGTLRHTTFQDKLIRKHLINQYLLDLPDKYDVNQERTLPCIQHENSGRCKRVSWSVVSKAALTSWSRSNVTRWFFILRRMSLVTLQCGL